MANELKVKILNQKTLENFKIGTITKIFLHMLNIFQQLNKFVGYN